MCVWIKKEDENLNRKIDTPVTGFIGGEPNNLEIDDAETTSIFELDHFNQLESNQE